MDNDQLPSVVDLFSGCGGLSLGLKASGFSIAGGADIDNAAIKTANYNLHFRFGSMPRHTEKDITKLYVKDLILNPSSSGYVVVGGPPCQAYSRVGRGKLRSLGADRHHLNDPRGNLYEDFIRLCLEADAQAILMENVPEIINYGDLNIPESICEILELENYSAGWTVLNSADYGVPQIRERVFIIGIKKKYCNEITFPAATHADFSSSPSYLTMRKKNFNSFLHYITPSIAAGENLQSWVSVSEAISDLPSLFPSPNSNYVLHQPKIVMKYKSRMANDYQKKMRTWYGNDHEYVSGHSFRKTKRDFKLFDKMEPGNNFQDVIRISEEMFESVCIESGINRIDHPDRYKLLYKRIVPPYSRDKFHDKWKRLIPEKPSSTITAHLSIDTYSHIHPWEPRGISVREAARLQSFPDGFLFTGTMGEAYKQIGNAVPPLLAKVLGEHLLSLLKGE
jgi:DNA (cytosine-5)-methyltransferase 1